MFNKNINGNVNLSVKLANITSESGIKENAFGIKVKDLYNLAKSVCTVPVLRVVDAVNGSIVEYTLIEYKKVSTGYTFMFVGKDFLTLTFTNSTGKYTATITPIGSGSDTGLEIELGNIRPGVYTGDDFRALDCYDAVMELIETENPEGAYTTRSAGYIGRLGAYTKREQPSKQLDTYFLECTPNGICKVALRVTNYDNPETISFTYSWNVKNVFAFGLVASYDLSGLTFPETYTHADFESLDFEIQGTVIDVGYIATELADAGVAENISTAYIDGKAYALGSATYDDTSDAATVTFVNISGGTVTEIGLEISDLSNEDEIALETTKATYTLTASNSNSENT